MKSLTESQKYELAKLICGDVKDWYGLDHNGQPVDGKWESKYKLICYDFNSYRIHQQVQRFNDNQQWTSKELVAYYKEHGLGGTK